MKKGKWRKIYIVYEYELPFTDIVQREEMITNIKDDHFLEYHIEKELELGDVQYDRGTINVISFSYMNWGGLTMDYLILVKIDNENSFVRYEVLEIWAADNVDLAEEISNIEHEIISITKK